MKKIITSLIIFGLCFLSSQLLQAQNTVWNGSVSSDWFTAANWSNGVPNTSTGIARINTASNPCIIGSGQTATTTSVIIFDGSLTIENGALLDLDNAVGSGFRNDGVGTFVNNGTLMIDNVTAGNGDIGFGYSTGSINNTNAGSILIGTDGGNIASGFKMNIEAAAVMNNNSLIRVESGGTSIIVNSSGSATLNNNACAQIIVDGALFQANGGIINNTGYIKANSFSNFANNGIVEDVNETFSSTNNAIVIVPISSPNCSNNFSNALQNVTPNNFSIATTWYSDIGLNTSVGAYNAGTNIFSGNSNLPSGTSTVYFEITDNVNNCNRIASIEVTNNADNTPPTITCPANITVNNDAGLCTANVTYTTPVGTDNCPSPTTTQIQGIASGADFPVGITTNTFEVSDGISTDQCSFTVTVNDTEPPVFTFCPSDIVQGTDPGNCNAVVNFDAPTATDNCVLGVQGVLATDYNATNGQRGVMFNITATTTLNITKFDANLYAGTTARYEIYYKAGQFQGSQNNASAWTFVGGANGVTSLGFNVPTPLPIPVNVVIPAGETYGFYVTNTFNGGLSYTDGNSANELLASNDDMTINGGIGKSYPFGINFNPRGFNGTVHYGGDLTIAQNQGPTSGSSFTVGTTNVNFVATDGAGNMTNCNFDVTVNDNENPMANCQDIDVQLDANNSATLTAAQIDGGSTDNCSVSVSIPPTTFGCDDVGTPQSVVLTATDGSNNTNTCTATVTVLDDDNPCCEAPVANCQSFTAVVDANGMVTITAADVGGNSTADCGLLSLEIDNAMFDCSDIGTSQNVELTITDINNDSDNCTAVVTVEDQTPPTPICQPFTAMLDANGVATVTLNDVLASASDNCGVLPGGQLTQTLFTCTEQGNNMVTVTVTDINGLNGSCQATVTLQDDIAPVAMCQNSTIQLDENGDATIVAEDIDGGTTDNCSFTLSASQTTFDCSDLGENTVILTADDGTNTNTCNAIVTVEDETAPVANCQNVTINLDENGDASTTANDVNNGSSDACGITTLTLSKTDFDCSNLGLNEVTLTVGDESGNSSTCTATVIVNDEIPAIILCRPNVNTVNDPGVCGAVVNPLPPLVIEENCSIGNVTNDAPTLFEIGTTLVTWTITDAGGNETECLQNVTVKDTEAPVVDCGQPFHAYLAEVDDDAPTNENNCHFPSYLLDPLMVISDNCDDTDLTITNDAPAFFTHGSYTVTYTFVDSNGNVATCEQSVKVWDITAPTLTSCPENIEVEATETDGADVFWSLPTAVDNCPSHDILLVEDNGYEPGDFFELGETAIQYNVYDENGQFTECNFTINVVPVGTLNLELFCMEELNISQQNATSWSVFDWNPPLMATNCDQCDVLASDDFRYIGTLTGHQYYFQMADTMTYFEALAYAENLNTTLAILNNKKEVPMIENELPTGNYFIGLIDEDGMNEFQWINGDEFDATEFGQSFENLTEEPAAVILNEDGEWEVVDLNTEASFVFENVCIDLKMAIEQNDNDNDEEMVEINTIAEVGYNAMDTCGNTTSCGFEITFTEENVDYCPQTGIASDNDQPFFLESFTLGDLTNESGDNDGYGDYTNKHFVFEVNETVEMSAIFEGTDIDSVPMYCRIWIDYNQDGDFFDENELAYEGVEKGAANGILTMANLPQTVENTRMRIAISRLTFSESCGDYWNGETEDYSISIIVAEDPIFGNRSLGNRNTNNSAMLVYPNPADDNFDIILKSENGETATIRLFNRIGQQVATQKIATNETVNVDIRDYPNGLYSIIAEVNGEMQIIQKIVIEHK